MPNLAAANTSALVVDSDIFFYGRRDRIVSLEARHAIPARHSDRAFVLCTSNIETAH